VLRDVATAAELGADAHVIGTAWTEQGDQIHRVEPRDPAAVAESLARAIATRKPAAVKVGMTVDPATAGAICEGLAGFGGPVVVDPVLATSRGGPLWAGQPSGLMPLLRRATLVTPNAGEAAALTGGPPVLTPSDAEAAGRWLVAQGVAAALIKGGHLNQEELVTDVLVSAAGTRLLRHARLPGPSPRGTGCALATAVAFALGSGQPLEEAVRAGIDWLAEAIAAAGPVGTERHLRRRMPASGGGKSARRARRADVLRRPE